MSAVGRGKSAASQGLDGEVLVPLLARLAALKAFLTSAAVSGTGSADPYTIGPPRRRHEATEDFMTLETRALLQKIERELAELKGVVSRVDEIDKEIRYSFDPVERHISEALRCKPIETYSIYSMLLEVDTVLGTIKAKMRAAYNLPRNDDDCCSKEGDQEADGNVIASSSARRDSQSQSQAAHLAEKEKEGKKKKTTLEVEEIRHSPPMRHLSLAVRGLEDRLRGCVLCLAAFPEEEDAIIKKRILIHWWMAEGFVGSSTEGNSRFLELVGKGLVTPLPKAHCGKIHRWKLRPWIRGLLADIARSNGFLDADVARARRVLLHGGKPTEPPPPSTKRKSKPSSSSSSTRQVQVFNTEVTIIYNISQKYVQLTRGWFAGKKELRMLQLGQWRQFGPREQIADPNQSHIEVSGTEHFAELEKCTNLRYISFRGISRIQSLPNSIGKLRQLVVLDLRACHDLEELGQGITKLDLLEYLDLSDCHLLIGIPKGIGRLTRLEVLKGFVIANLNCKDPCRLNELTKLHKLRKLSITIGTTSAPAVDEFKKLGELKALKSLAIVWGVKPALSSPLPIIQTKFVLPPDLQKLDLRCFPLNDFQQWVRPKDVKKLYIRGGNLRTLGDDDDWEVEVLQLRFLKDFQFDLGRLQHSFKKLKPDLTLIHDCPNFRA